MSEYKVGFGNLWKCVCMVCVRSLEDEAVTERELSAANLAALFILALLQYIC